MSGLNLSFDGGSSVSTAVAQLAGNAIHDVAFKGVESKQIESKDGTKFNILSIKFANEDGVYEDSIFEPKAGDEKRKANNFGYENPSANEEMMFKIKHLLAAVAPKVAAQIEEKGGLNVGTWEALCDFVTKHTAKAIGTETQIKLLERIDGKGVKRAHFPSFVLGINKEGKAYPKTNFIGAKLAFTAKEQEKIAAATTAVPNSPESFMTESAPAATPSLDLDFDLV